MSLSMAKIFAVMIFSAGCSRIHVDLSQLAQDEAAEAHATTLEDSTSRIKAAEDLSQVTKHEAAEAEAATLDDSASREASHTDDTRHEDTDSVALNGTRSGSGPPPPGMAACCRFIEGGKTKCAKLYREDCCNGDVKCATSYKCHGNLKVYPCFAVEREAFGLRNGQNGPGRRSGSPCDVDLTRSYITDTKPHRRVAADPRGEAGCD